MITCSDVIEQPWPEGDGVWISREWEGGWESLGVLAQWQPETCRCGEGADV